MSGHAILSPSSAARWLNCPPSAKINAEAPDRDTVYTREGTLAHALGELKARNYFIGLSFEHFRVERDGLMKHPEYAEEMADYTDDYLAALKDIALTYAEKPYVALEQRVDFSRWVPEGFGTADCLMIGGDVMQIVDFKYGKGVAVDVVDNPQLKLYALGALEVYDMIYDVQTVRLTIVQPRVAGYQGPLTWETSADALRDWAERVVAPIAKQAYEGKGEFHEGEWCRFCAIKGSCAARAEANLDLARMDFRKPPELSDADVAEALRQGQRLSEWLNDLKDYALGACLDGRDIPGWKAVAGRSVRAWTDEDGAFDAAQAAGVPEEMLYERKRVTLAGLEKIMGKKPFNEALGAFVTTPPGKPTLVPATDRRAAVTGRPTAAEDFGNDEI